MSDKLDALLPDSPAPVTIAGRTFSPEPMCAYKVAHILKALSRFSDDIKIAEVIEGLTAANGQMNIAQVAASFLPRLMVLAPDALVSLLALAVIPNEELMSLYKTPGAIDNRVADELLFFNFRATSGEIAELATAYIPMIGFESLKKSLPVLGQRVMDSLGVQLQEPSKN